MDAALKARWVGALRSGRYKQGVGALRRDGKYCCLGVLTELLGEPVDDDIEGRMDLPPYYPADTAIDNHEMMTSLAFANDSGQTFLEIADRIEREL